MRSLLAFAGCRDLPPLAIAWSGADATGAPLVLAHTGAAVAVARNEQGTVRAGLAGTLFKPPQLQPGIRRRQAPSGARRPQRVRAPLEGPVHRRGEGAPRYCRPGVGEGGAAALPAPPGAGPRMH